MTQLLYTNLGRTYDISTESGKAACFGKPDGTPMLIYDESGEIINFYSHPADAERNGLFIKSLRDKYPNQPLLKALDMHERELMLKSRPQAFTKPKQEPLLKSIRAKLEQIGKMPADRKFKKLMALFDEI